jgi:hypothetical protein
MQRRLFSAVFAIIGAVLLVVASRKLLFTTAPGERVIQMSIEFFVLSLIVVTAAQARRRQVA